jgi:hypothetical protein
MAQELEELLDELDDPRHYVKVPNRVVFDAHEEVWDEPILDEDGEPKKGKDGKPVTEKKRRTFNEPALRYIAERCNERDEQGNLCQLAIGHTRPGRPEVEQPEAVGYSRNFHTEYEPRLKRHVIKADYYIRADEYAKARSYPNTSVELWPPEATEEDADAWFFHPICLIRRTPKRPVGQWTYAMHQSGRRVIRYAMEDKAADDMPPVSDPEEEGGPEGGGEDLPSLDAPGPSPGGIEDESPESEAAEPSHPEKVEQYMKHCYGHPYARYFAKHYAADSATNPEGGGEMEEESPEVPPTEPPSAEGPDQYAAALSGTNAMPQPVGKKDQVARMQRDQKASQQARHDARIAALEKELKVMRYERDRADCERMVMQLESENVELDRAEEVEELLKRKPEDREKYLDRCRKRYQRAPIGGNRIPVTRGPGVVGKPDVDPHTGELSRECQARILLYQKEHGWCEWEDAKKAVLSAMGHGPKEGKEGTNGTSK